MYNLNGTSSELFSTSTPSKQWWRKRQRKLWSLLRSSGVTPRLPQGLEHRPATSQSRKHKENKGFAVSIQFELPKRRKSRDMISPHLDYPEIPDMRLIIPQLPVSSDLKLMQYRAHETNIKKSGPAVH